MKEMEVEATAEARSPLLEALTLAKKLRIFTKHPEESLPIILGASISIANIVTGDPKYIAGWILLGAAFVTVGAMLGSAGRLSETTKTLVQTNQGRSDGKV